MWISGLAISAVGVTGDVKDWWEHLQFVNNLLSSLASALFGLPVALIYLQRANLAEARHRRRQELVHLARIAVDDVVDNIDDITNDPDKLAALRDVNARLNGTAFTRFRRHRYTPELAAVLDDWLKMSRLIREVFVDSISAMAAITRARAEWLALRDQIAPSLRPFELNWITTADGRLLDRLLHETSLENLTLREDPTTAVEKAIRDESTTPIEQYYNDAFEAGVAEMETHANEVYRAVRDVIALRAAALRLQSVIQAEHLSQG
jgi:hypothetical protein